MSSGDLTLGEKIEAFRKRAKMSQLDLEIEIGAGQGSLSRIENNQVNPTKETLLKLVDVLNLSPVESASLFSIDIEPEVRKVIDVSQTLNEADSLEEMINVITRKISIFAGGNASTLWFWDSEKSYLNLKRIMALPKVIAFVENVLHIPWDNITFDASNIEYQKSDYIKCILENKPVVSNTLYDLASPMVNRTICSIISKWLNFNLAVSLPLSFKGIKLGVFSLIWDGDRVSEKDLRFLQAYADQIAVAIYNAQKYEKLNKELNDLKKKYGE